MPNFFKQIKKRWKDETPKFWKTIRNYMIGLGTSAVGLIGVDKLFDLQAYGVAPVVFQVASYIIVFCAAVGLSAQITHNNKEDEDDSN